jgi:hypothetical protein
MVAAWDAWWTAMKISPCTDEMASWYFGTEYTETEIFF